MAFGGLDTSSIIGQFRVAAFILFHSIPLTSSLFSTTLQPEVRRERTVLKSEKDNMGEISLLIRQLIQASPVKWRQC